MERIMREPLKVVDEIRMILEERGSPAAGSDALAREYTELCLDCQDRLYKCVGLISQGLSSEAVYEAESEPPLLVRIAALDFPDASAWRAWAAQQGLPTPPEFDAQHILRLDQEYTKHNEIEPLVDTYRRLSIKQAPATERIQVLRRLVIADPTNPNWVRDLAAVEGMRLREITAALQSHRSKVTEELADTMVAELAAMQRSRPSPDVVQDAEMLRLQLRTSRFHAEVEALARRVNDAYTAMDAREAARLLAEIDARAARERLTIPNPIAQSIYDARAWSEEQQLALKREREFEQGCGELVSALDREATSAELAGLLAKLMIYDRDLPGELAERARTQVLVRRLQEQRRARLRTAGVVSAIVLVLAGLGALASFFYERHERSRLADELGRVTKAYDFAAGRALIDSIRRSRPERFNDEALSRAAAQFESEEKRETERAAAFLGELRRLDEMDVTQPTTTIQVERLERLARRSDEKEMLSGAMATLAAKRLAAQKSADTQLIGILEQLDPRYEALTRSSEPSDIRSNARAMDVLLQQAEIVLGASPQLAGKVADFRKRQGIELARADQVERDAREIVHARGAVRRELEQAITLLPDVQAYHLGWLNVKRKHARLFASLSDWGDTAAAISAVVEIRRVLDSPDPGGAESTDPATLAKRLEGVTSHRLTPYYASVERFKASNQFAADFDEQVENLREKLIHPLISQVITFTVSRPQGDPVRYYAPRSAKPEPQALGLAFKYYDAQHRERGSAPQAAATLVEPVTVAPHSRLASDLLERLEEAQSSKDWHGTIPAMLAETLDAKAANSRVQAFLAETLLALNESSGNPAKLTPDMQQAIRSLSPEHINFLAPSDDVDVARALAEVARRLQRVAPKIVTHLRSLDKRSSPQHQADLAGLRRPLTISAVVGITDDGRPTIIPTGEGPRTEYWRIRLAGDRSTFEIVATASGAGVNWIVGGDMQPPVGAPLFSPTDGLSTRRLLDDLERSEREPPPSWPSNARDAGDRQQNIP